MTFRVFEWRFGRQKDGAALFIPVTDEVGQGKVSVATPVGIIFAKEGKKCGFLAFTMNNELRVAGLMLQNVLAEPPGEPPGEAVFFGVVDDIESFFKRIKEAKSREEYLNTLRDLGSRSGEVDAELLKKISVAAYAFGFAVGNKLPVYVVAAVSEFKKLSGFSPEIA